MREKGISLNERRFATDCIDDGQRLDGRKLTDPRPVSIQLGPSWGFAEVSLEQTQAIASTTVEAVTPASDRPSEGSLSISIDTSPASSETAARDALQRNPSHSHHHHTASLEIRHAIESFVRDSRALDTEALCILQGVKVWNVRVNVDVVNDDGNATDVAMLAVMASLLHARRPDVTVTGREVRVHSMDEREAVALPVHHVPLAVTFAMYGEGKPYEDDTAVVDPTKLEELASNGACSFAFNAQGEVCGVFKAGGLPLRPQTFAECATLAAARVVELTVALKKALADAAGEHPLAGTTRPMLVEPEAVAVIRTEIASGGDDDDDDDDEMEDVPMSTWNAKPHLDDAPPQVTDAHQLDATELDNAKSIQVVFEKKKSNAAKDGMLHSKGTEDMDEEQDEEDEDSDQSSDDDLTSAIISKKLGKRR